MSSDRKPYTLRYRILRAFVYFRRYGVRTRQVLLDRRWRTISTHITHAGAKARLEIETQETNNQN